MSVKEQLNSLFQDNFFFASQNSVQYLGITTANFTQQGSNSTAFVVLHPLYDLFHCQSPFRLFIVRISLASTLGLGIPSLLKELWILPNKTQNVKQNKKRILFRFLDNETIEEYQLN
jgi:hypothetical protein